VARASAKWRFSTTTAEQFCRSLRLSRAVIAARSATLRAMALCGHVVLPGGIQIPTVLGRVVADVVAHRPAARDPVGPLLAAVREPDGCSDLQVRPELGGQRGGHLDPQPAGLIDPDRLIAAGLAALPVGS
jgi:hypothetical protein